MKFRGKNWSAGMKYMLSRLVAATSLSESQKDGLIVVVKSHGVKGKSIRQGFSNISIREPATDALFVDLVLQPEKESVARELRLSVPSEMTCADFYQELCMAHRVEVAVKKLGRKFFSNGDFRAALLLIVETLPDCVVLSDDNEVTYRLADSALDPNDLEAFERGLIRADVMTPVVGKSDVPAHTCGNIDSALFRRFVEHGCALYEEAATQQTPEPTPEPMPEPTPEPMPEPTPSRFVAGMSFEDRLIIVLTCVQFTWFNRQTVKHLWSEMKFGNEGGLKAWLTSNLFKYENGRLFFVKGNARSKKWNFRRAELSDDVLRRAGLLDGHGTSMKTRTATRVQTSSAPVQGTPEWVDWMQVREQVLADQVSTLRVSVAEAETLLKTLNGA